MDLKALNEKFENCACGKKHCCPIDHIAIGKGAIEKLPEMCTEYKAILMVCDQNTFAVCGERVGEILGDKIITQMILKDNGEVLIPNEEKIAEIEDALSSEADFILGVGAGVINDLCKHVSFKHSLPYGIVATAPSMDGYASSGAALILEGMKVTLGARPPKVIIGDTDALKTAPREMIQAGYGDIVGKYSCLNDWKLSALINGEFFCPDIYDLTLSQAEKVRPLATSLLERKEDAVEALMEALVTVGVAMSYLGNSRPASGSEHHLSHYFEITGILENKPYYSHGIDVMYSAAVTARIREEIISAHPEIYCFDKKEWLSEIERIYLSSAEGVVKLQEGLGWYETNEFESILEKENEIKALLKESPSFAEMLTMLSEIDLSYEEFTAFYGTEKIDDGILYAKDLKDRYSVLWLYYKYFRKGI